MNEPGWVESIVTWAWGMLYWVLGYTGRAKPLDPISYGDSNPPFGTGVVADNAEKEKKMF